MHRPGRRPYVALSACLLLLLLVVAACGGGSGSPPADPTPDPTPEPTPSAALTALVASAGPLMPAFDPATLAYTVGPGLGAGSTTVAATTEDAAATLTINGVATSSGAPSASIPLAIGITPVDVVVTASDATIRTYTIVFERTTLAGQDAYLKAATLDSEDHFGRSVAVSGDTVVVGAWGEDGDGSAAIDDSAPNAGAAYVFVRSGAMWSQQAYLKASNTDRDDEFGTSVAISGDTIVVGAPDEEGDGSDPSDNSASHAGAAYVFVRTGTTWTQQAYLKASNAGASDGFGGSVAIDGETLVVGASTEAGNGISPNDNSAGNSGAVYVFQRTGTTWTEQAYLKAPNVDGGDHFGASVAISGDTLVVGALGESSDGSGESDNSAFRAGAAYVFVRSGTTWADQAYLKASNAEAEDWFGIRVGVSGDTAVVTAHREDSDGSGEGDNSMSNSGAAYVFVRSGSVWSQQAYLKASNPDVDDFMGGSVALWGDTVVVGASQEDGDGSSEADDSAATAGAVYTFVRSGSTWTQYAYLKASNVEAFDEFGCSVALSGGTIVVGAHFEDGNGSSESDNSLSKAGAAYVLR